MFSPLLSHTTRGRGENTVGGTHSLQMSNPGSLELSKFMVPHDKTLGAMSVGRRGVGGGAGGEQGDLRTPGGFVTGGFPPCSVSASSPLDSKHGGEPGAHAAAGYMKPKADETLSVAVVSDFLTSLLFIA